MTNPTGNFQNPVRCTACGETCESSEATRVEGYVYCPACIAAERRCAFCDGPEPCNKRACIDAALAVADYAEGVSRGDA